jgi:hypothetical protein
MTPDRWERVKEIYESAFHVRPRERRALLDRACAKDAALRQEVERLLRADQSRERAPAKRGSQRPAALKDARLDQQFTTEPRALVHPSSLREAWRTIVGSLRHQSPLRIRFVR